MESFNHISPIDNIEDPYSHKMELIVDGEKVGEADVEYFSRPFPLYQISSMGVEFEKQGQGFGSKLMGYIEGVLKKKGKAGVLVDAIDPSSPAAGMYARRGWIEVPDSNGLHVFNMPKGATIDQLKGYVFRYTDPAIREGNNVE
ncbi:MAG: Acetyltransferase domain [Candidatus Paceibacter sp.]|nr:Acetyltransferase domain [Candidatus Paceibacter sp.]